MAGFIHLQPRIVTRIIHGRVYHQDCLLALPPMSPNPVLRVGDALHLRGDRVLEGSQAMMRLRQACLVALLAYGGEV